MKDNTNLHADNSMNENDINNSINKSSNLQTFAAIDLGSNSFHLIVAQVKNEQLLIIDRLKEMVRLASGLDSSGKLTQESQQSGLDCLARFGQRLKNIPHKNIRIVGTNTLRKAKNGQEFIIRAEAALHHDIEIIAGREEARLIYLGVAHSQSENTSNRLVIDIGGGSTEFIIGLGFNPVLTESLHMGCVSMTLKAFSDGNLSEKNFKKAETYAKLELQSIKNNYRQIGWDFATGASGTIKAIGKVLQEYHEASKNDPPFRGITLEGIKWLKAEMIGQKRTIDLSLGGLNSERQAVFAGGVAILSAAFKVLKIAVMNVSDSALREGVIYDMQGRINHEDVRQRTINHLINQYHIDIQQANAVKECVVALYIQVKQTWQIDPFDSLQLLEWAAMLHEIGLSIAHNQYHKHGAYIIENSDLPGFSQQDKFRLGLLIHAQRRKIPKQEFKRLSEPCNKSMIYLAVLLRLGILLHRDRSKNVMPKLRVKATEQQLIISFPDGFFDEHPLTFTDLEFEADHLRAIDFNLLFI
jgi:exopolyphosphatase/guanosine-5'-triphosphate,3'-diphosphate pyrophosphatase